MKNKKPISTGALLGWLFGLVCGVPVMVAFGLYVVACAYVVLVTVGFASDHGLLVPLVVTQSVVAGYLAWVVASGMWAMFVGALHGVAGVLVVLLIIRFLLG